MYQTLTKINDTYHATTKDSTSIVCERSEKLYFQKLIAKKIMVGLSGSSDGFELGLGRVGNCFSA